MSEQQNSIFVKKPSYEELKRNLALVEKIIQSQANHDKVVIENGVVYVIKDNGKEEIGILSDISQTTKELFGESDPPEGVEYVVISGVCFMTYYGNLIACGDAASLKEPSTLSSKLSALISSINDFINDDVISSIGDMIDENTGKKYCSFASSGVAVLVELIKIRKVETNDKDFDELMKILTNLENIDENSSVGGKTILDTYAGMASKSTLQSLVTLFQTELEMGDKISV